MAVSQYPKVMFAAFPHHNEILRVIVESETDKFIILIDHGDARRRRRRAKASKYGGGFFDTFEDARQFLYRHISGKIEELNNDITKLHQRLAEVTDMKEPKDES